MYIYIRGMCMWNLYVTIHVHITHTLYGAGTSATPHTHCRPPARSSRPPGTGVSSTSRARLRCGPRENNGECDFSAVRSPCVCLFWPGSSARSDPAGLGHSGHQRELPGRPRDAKWWRLGVAVHCSRCTGRRRERAHCRLPVQQSGRHCHRAAGL